MLHQLPKNVISSRLVARHCAFAPSPLTHQDAARITQGYRLVADKLANGKERKRSPAGVCHRDSDYGAIRAPASHRAAGRAPPPATTFPATTFPIKTESQAVSLRRPTGEQLGRVRRVLASMQRNQPKSYEAPPPKCAGWWSCLRRSASVTLSPVARNPMARNLKSHGASMARNYSLPVPK